MMSVQKAFGKHRHPPFKTNMTATWY